MGDVTRLLERWAVGDPEAFRALMPLVYQELRGLAAHYLRSERSDHTLQPTALVHEAYLRLAGNRDLQLRNRSHFYGAAAQVMRRVLVDHARHHRSLKRGGPKGQALPLDEAIDVSVDLRMDFVALDQALEALQRIAPAAARVVELRYFGGLSVDETASYLEIAPATVKRRWVFARAWLFRRLSDETHQTAAGFDQAAPDTKPEDKQRDGLPPQAGG
jgi:RNA polymerase sigma factor (TIGR02999 family)